MAHLRIHSSHKAHQCLHPNRSLNQSLNWGRGWRRWMGSRLLGYASCSRRWATGWRCPVRGRVYQPAVAFCAAPHTRLAPSDAHAATGTTHDHHRYYDRQHEHHHRPQHNQQQQHGGQQQMQQGHAQGHAGHGLVEGTEEGTEPLLLGNILTDGTIIDIFGTLLLYSSPVSMARNVQVSQ